MVATSRLGPPFPLPADEPFTRREALRSGVTRWDLDRLLTEGLLRRPIHGVYAATLLGDSLALRAACLKLVAPEDAVIVDRHAGWLHGAEMVLRPQEHLQLQPVSMYLPTPGRRLRCALADSGERTFGRGDVIEVAGLQVTSPLRTSWDLGRTRWLDDAVSALDTMLRLRQFSADELIVGVERFKGMRWVTTLRTAATLADARAESPGESVLRLRGLEARLRLVPQLEVWSGDRFIARLDLADETLKLGIEYDGEEWHSSDQQRAADEERRSALRDLGWTILVFTRHEVYGQARTVDLEIAATARALRRQRGAEVVSDLSRR